MVKLNIDHKEVFVEEGTSVLQAAASVGIDIPSMCFMEGFTNHPSCMVCLVKDSGSGKLFPSCATQVAEGMEIISDDEDVKQARREALELLLSDHVGDCEAPCRNGCPAFMNIPLMNRLIAQGNNLEAIKVVKEHIALPLILGYICPAPCEKVCRRKPIDDPVSICQLKKFVAATDLLNEKPFFPEKVNPTGKRIAIAGAGPAGLSAAFYLVKSGHECIVYDEKEKAGGYLNLLSDEVLPKKILQDEINYLEHFGVKFELDQKLDKSFVNGLGSNTYDVLIIASGEKSGLGDWGLEKSELGAFVDADTYQTTRPAVFACGSVIKKLDMAVKAVAQGKVVSESVNLFLMGKDPVRQNKMFNSKFGKLLPDEYNEYLKESVPYNRINPSGGELQGFDKVEAAREALRCMHCDCRKPVDCKLRIYADQYGVNRRKYITGERKIIKKSQNHEKVIFEPEKCIKCGLCVEITVKNKELKGLTFIGRGFDVEVKIPFNASLEEALAKTAVKCAEACPTGAIALKK